MNPKTLNQKVTAQARRHEQRILYEKYIILFGTANEYGLSLGLRLINSIHFNWYSFAPSDYDDCWWFIKFLT